MKDIKACCQIIWFICKIMLVSPLTEFFSSFSIFNNSFIVKIINITIKKKTHRKPEYVKSCYKLKADPFGEVPGSKGE